MPPKNSSSEVFMKVKSRFYEQIDLETLRTSLDALVEADEAAAAVGKLQEWIIGNPLDENAFLLLGELYEQLDNTNAAVVAFQRAMELKELSASYEPSPSFRRYQEIQRQLDDDATNEVSLTFDLKTRRLERSINAMSNDLNDKKVSR